MLYEDGVLIDKGYTLTGGFGLIFHGYSHAHACEGQNSGGETT